MAIKKYLPVLLMTLLRSVSTNQDVYCEVEDYSHRHRHSPLNITCKNASIQGVIRVSDYSQHETYKDVKLTFVSADIQNNTLEYFPQLHSLIIFHSNINSFSLHSGIKQLGVFTSTFPRVTSDVLMGCKNLTFIYFISNYGLQFDEGAFKYLKDLNLLLILNNTIPKLTRGLFVGLENLTYLYLVSDNIQEIDKDAFVDLLKVKTMNLDGNPLESFNVNISGLTKLSYLSFLNTNLKRLNFDVLGSVRGLQGIGLSRKLLRNIIATQLVTKIRRLDIVYVHPGELNCPEVVSLANELEERITVREDRFMAIPEIAAFIKPSTC